jgi:hypothetical protein
MHVSEKTNPAVPWLLSQPLVGRTAGKSTNNEVSKMNPFLIDWHALHEILQVVADIIAIIRGLQR